MKKIICWGAGKRGEEVISYLSSKQYKIIYFVDVDKEKWGQNFDSYTIKEPCFAVNDIKQCEFILITSQYWEEIFIECLGMGICSSKIKYFDVRDFGIKSLDEMHAKKIFSQEGEEIFLKERFKGRTGGIYVDVGAFHPYRISNTYWAYERGWRGINIEPNYINYRLLCLLRPEDININCGISNYEGLMNYYSFKNGAINTFCLDKLTNKEDAEKVESICKVTVKRLDCIFEKYKIKKIEYIDIDVEGMELEVLQSINWDTVSIDCILLEQRKMTLLDVIKSDVYEFLKDKGYVPVNKYNRTVIYEKI